MPGTQQVRNVVERLDGEQSQGLRADLQDFAAVELSDRQVLRCAFEPSVLRRIVTVLEDGLIDELGHRGWPPRRRARAALGAPGLYLITVKRSESIPAAAPARLRCEP